MFPRRFLFSLIFIAFLITACKTPEPARQLSQVVQSSQTSSPASPVRSTIEVTSDTNIPVVKSDVVPLEKHKPRRIKIGLALGGGAARGFAHVGVIKVLESQGINVEVIAGTSAGSLVGALYSAGNNGFELQKMALNIDEATISDWIVPLFAKSTGVLKGEGLQNYVNQGVRQLPIEKLNKTFGAVATDLNTGLPMLFRRGNTAMAVRASSAVPGVFQPVKIGDKMYVDGGLVAPVPVTFARDMGADFVIAVNISSQPNALMQSSSLTVLMQTFSIMGQTINQVELKNADIVIRPELAEMKGNDFAGRNLAILAGEHAALRAMPEIKRKLKELHDKVDAH